VPVRCHPAGAPTEIDGLVAARDAVATSRFAAAYWRKQHFLCLHWLDLRCEYAVDPLGIDTPRPRLAWTLQHPERGQQQTAYQILVAASLERLAEGSADLWDSGKVISDGVIPAEYDGRPLHSGERASGKGRAWDQQDVPGPFSAPASRDRPARSARLAGRMD
jgi:hypothetical protein